MERAGVEFFKKKHPKVKRVKEILARAAREARGARLKRAKRASGGPGSPRLFSRQRGNFFEIKKFLQLKIVKNARGRVDCLLQLFVHLFRIIVTSCAHSSRSSSSSAASISSSPIAASSRSSS